MHESNELGPPVEAAQLRTPLLRRILQVVRTDYDPDFAFRSLGPIPWARAPADLARVRVALITTAGLHRKVDPPFVDSRWGDTSFRLVPHLTPADRLALDDDLVDAKYTPQDPEVALPMAALQRLFDAGRVGVPAPRHASFCGGLVRPLPGLATSSAQLLAVLREDRADVAVILPTCSLCVQSVCIIARELERRGLPTVVLSFLPELTEIVGAPRGLSVAFPFGAPCGNPGNAALHEAVLWEALQLLHAAAHPGTIVASKHPWKRSPSDRAAAQ